MDFSHLQCKKVNELSSLTLLFSLMRHDVLAVPFVLPLFGQLDSLAPVASPLANEVLDFFGNPPILLHVCS
jgi:hypothetical protein